MLAAENQKSNYWSTKFWVLVLFIGISFFYNVQIPVLRLIFVLLILALPLYLLLNVKLAKSFYILLALFLVPILYMLIVVLLRANSFELNINGPQGEILAAFVGVSFIFSLMLFLVVKTYNLNPHQLLDSVVFMLLFVSTLDMAFRYFAEPQCFMNYFCRREAKIVGFFATSNVTGVNIATLLMFIISAGFAKHY